MPALRLGNSLLGDAEAATELTLRETSAFPLVTKEVTGDLSLPGREFAPAAQCLPFEKQPRTAAREPRGTRAVSRRGELK